MATIVGSRTPLFYKAVPGGPPVILDTSKFTGNIFYVDSAVGTDGAGYGATPDAPFATLDYAIGKCTASQGDTILVLPGHAETLEAVITADVAGIAIIGLGHGDARPDFTCNAVADGITVTANDVWIENLRFPAATAAATALINVAAANCRIRGCRFELGANVLDAITVTAAGETLTVEDCEVIVTADGPDSWIKFEGVVDRPIIRRNYVVGSDGTDAFDDGVFDFDSVAVTNPIIVNNVFADNDIAVTVAANVGAITGELIGPNSYGLVAVNVDNTGITLASLGAGSITAAAMAVGALEADAFAAASIEAAALAADTLQAIQDEVQDAIQAEELDHLTSVAVANNADMTVEVIDGSILSNIMTKGGDTSNFAPATDSLEGIADTIASGEQTCDGIVVTRATAALPQGTDEALFTVTGLCLLKRIVGYVTVTVGNVPNATKLKINPDGVGADTDICGTLDIDNAAVGTFFEVTGTFANAMRATVDLPIAKAQAAELVMPPGAIEIDCVGNDGGNGRVKWSVTYVPLEDGASIVAA